MSDSLNLLAYQAGLVTTPATEQGAEGYSDLCVEQQIMRIGDPLPIIFARREGTVGGVLASPGATEVRFENDSMNVLTTSWHLCLGEGPITPIQARDVFQCACRVGSATQAFGQRAGSWAPGNFVTELGDPYTPWDLPRFCGSAGTHDGLHTLSFVNSFEDSENWNQQVHAFIRGGLKVTRLVDGVYGSSSNVVDLYLYLLRAVARVPDAMINFASLTLAAKFTNSLGMRFDGILGKEKTENLDDWCENILKPFFLLQRTRVAGQEGLASLLPINPDGSLNLGVITPDVTLTEVELDLENWDLEFLSLADRRPICAQMQWRQQNDGILSVVRTSEVRFQAPYDAPDGPFEQHDLSPFATSETHIVKVGAYIIAHRALTTHTLEVTGRPGAYNATVSDGSIIRVTVPIVVDGEFSATHSYCYRVVSVGYDLRGETKLSLIHLPLDSQGRSAISQVVAAAQPTGIVLPITFQGPVCDENSELDGSDLLEDVVDWGLPVDNPYQTSLGYPPPEPPPPPPPPPEDQGPTVTNVTTSSQLLQKADAGGIFTVTVDWSEPMNTSLSISLFPPFFQYSPRIEFSPDVNSTLSYIGASWANPDPNGGQSSRNTRFIVQYAIIDSGQVIADVMIDVTGGVSERLAPGFGTGFGQEDYEPQIHFSINMDEVPAPTGQGIILVPHAAASGEFIPLRYSYDFSSSRYGNLGDNYAKDNQGDVVDTDVSVVPSATFPGFQVVYDNVDISSLASNVGTNVCFATTNKAHGLLTGNTVTISGATPSEFNGTYPVTVTGESTFTYNASGVPPTTPATGTIQTDIRSKADAKMLAKAIASGSTISFSGGTAYPYSFVKAYWWGEYTTDAGIISTDTYYQIKSAARNYGYYYHLLDFNYGQAQKPNLYGVRLPPVPSQAPSATSSFFGTSTFEVIICIPKYPADISYSGQPNQIVQYLGEMLFILGGFDFEVGVGGTGASMQIKKGATYLTDANSDRLIIDLQNGDTHVAVARTAMGSSTTIYVAGQRVYSEPITNAGVDVQPLLATGFQAYQYKYTDINGANVSGTRKWEAITSSRNEDYIGFHSLRFTPYQALYAGAGISAPSRLSGLSGSMIIGPGS